MAFALLVGLSMTSCKKEYTITVVSNNTNWGTTQGTGVYVEGKTVEISAIPKSGYYFIKWNDNVTTNPRKIEVKGDATYTAYFSDDPNGGGGEGGDGDPLTMSGVISENVTWADRGLSVDYIIDGNLAIEGNALLTINPGVTIMFTGVNGEIYVGENAGLKMVGTADKPIILQGPANNPNNGSWNRVRINSTRSDNQFEYVQFLRGGSGDAAWDGVVSVLGKLSMKHCTISGSLCNGVSIENEGYLSAFENNTVTNCSRYPIYMERGYSACKGLGTGNSFISNTGGNVVFIQYGGIEMTTESLTLANIGYPYRFNESCGLGGNKTFTIQAGVVIEMAPNTSFNVGDVTTIVANGTASSPIIFRSSESGENWSGIQFYSTKNGNNLSYCQIKNCGISDNYGENCCLYICQDSKMTLNNNTFGPSDYYGVSIENIQTFGNITHSGNTFQNCTGGNVYIEYGGVFGGTEYEDGEILDQLP